MNDNLISVCQLSYYSLTSVWRRSNQNRQNYFLFQALEATGLRKSDPRLKEMVKNLEDFQAKMVAQSNKTNNINDIVIGNWYLKTQNRKSVKMLIILLFLFNYRPIWVQRINLRKHCSNLQGITSSIYHSGLPGVHQENWWILQDCFQIWWGKSSRLHSSTCKVSLKL